MSELEAQESDHTGALTRTWFVRMTAVSSLGNAMVHLVTTYAVYDLTQSVMASAMITVFAFIPSLLLGGVATWLVERFGGARLFVTGGISLAVVGMIPLVGSATGHLGVQNLLVWQLLVGITVGLISPAGGIVVKMLAAPGRIPELNGRLSRVKAMTFIIGFLVGGAVYTFVGPTLVFVFNVASYAGPVVVVLTAMRTMPVPAAAGRLRDLRVLRTDEPKLRALFVGAFASAIAGCFTVGLPAMAASIGSSPKFLVAFKVAYATGGLFVAVAVRRLHKRVRWGTVQRTCLLVSAAVLLLLALSIPGVRGTDMTLLVMCSLIVVIGFAVYLDNAVLFSLVQIAAPVEIRGAVFTGYRLMPMLAIPIGQQFFGFLADTFSLQVALSCFAIPLVLVVVLGPRLGQGSPFDTIDPLPARAEPEPRPNA